MTARKRFVVIGPFPPSSPGWGENHKDRTLSGLLVLVVHLILCLPRQSGGHHRALLPGFRFLRETCSAAREPSPTRFEWWDIVGQAQVLDIAGLPFASRLRDSLPGALASYISLCDACATSSGDLAPGPLVAFCTEKLRKTETPAPRS